MNCLLKHIVFLPIFFFQFIYCTKPDPKIIPEILAKNNFSWIEPGVIAGIAMPQTKEQIQALHDLGIGLVVSLINTVDPKIFDGIEIEHLILPISDTNPRIPTITLVDKFIKKSKEVFAKGKATVVHCQAGMGRTGTMLACWLLANKNMRPDEAIRFVRSRRLGSAADRAQELFIGEYYEELLKRSMKHPKKSQYTDLEQRLRQWATMGSKFLSEKNLNESVEAIKQRQEKQNLGEQAEASEDLGEFYGMADKEAETQRQAIALKDKLGNLKENLGSLKDKLTRLQQKLLLLKVKLEQAKAMNIKSQKSSIDVKRKIGYKKK